MILFGKGLLGEAVADVIICPLYSDLVFEKEHLRSFRAVLAKDINFEEHKRDLFRLNLDLGEFYLYSIPTGLKYNFSHVYYLIVKTFLQKPHFIMLREALSKILLNILDKQWKSVSFPLFFVDCFTAETELTLIKDAILEAYKANKNIESLHIYILGIPKEMFYTATRIFSLLPYELYSKNIRVFQESLNHKDTRYSKHKGHAL